MKEMQREKSKPEMVWNRPWILQRADPFVCRDGQGRYYFTASVPAYDRIVLRRADTLAGLAQAQETTVWHKHASGPMSEHVWAPELHFVQGKWYLYFAAGEKDDIWKIRPYVLECEGPEPMEGPWIEKGMLRRAADDDYSFEAFSLDATVFENRGKWYCVWSEKVGPGKQIANLYLAEMATPWSLACPQVLLSAPCYAWERVDFWVNEGPAFLRHGDRVFLTYSASATGACYCMGMLSAPADADLTDPAVWHKARRPVLASAPEKGLYGPGHNCFTTDEAGRDVMIYHARTTDAIVGDPLYNPNRHAMAMHVGWDAAGSPVFSYNE